MPELPDIEIYRERLETLYRGKPLRAFRVTNPFILRTYTPPHETFVGRQLTTAKRIGKRIALGFSGDLWCVIHLMVAGRLKRVDTGSKIPKKLGLLALDFEDTTLLLTEAGTKKRASVHLFSSWQEASQTDRGGIEPLLATPTLFQAQLQKENRTIKRALADPRLISGIGNAMSDEILFWARMSPVKLTSAMTSEEYGRIFVATVHTLRAWCTLLRKQVGDGFPEKVTAFHAEMAVHGRFKKPCRSCKTEIQRIRYASNETNYCPRCQTGGKLLADRSLSRLLRKDWPRNIDELEAHL